MKRVEMPKMGDTMEEGKILRWIKKEDDPVKKGESIAEVETDKVNIEIEAFASGVLRKILVSEGASAPIGTTIALIGAPDEPLPEEISVGGRSHGGSPQIASGRPGSTTISGPPLTRAEAGRAEASSAPTGGQGRTFISP